MSARFAIHGIGLWSPEYSSASQWHAGKTDVQAAPPALLLPARVRGRASLLTRMLAEVVGQVCTQCAIEPSAPALIVGSAYGEMITTAQLLQSMSTGDRVLSPARFQSSVHNTAAGLLSIATGARGFSSCIAAGEATSAAALLEACAVVLTRGGSALVALADEALPAFFTGERPCEPLALALLLTPAQGHDALAWFELPRTVSAERSAPQSFSSTRFSNPIAPLLDVIGAVMDGRSRCVRLPGIGSAWSVQVHAPAPQTPRQEDR